MTTVSEQPVLLLVDVGKHQNRQFHLRGELQDSRGNQRTQSAGIGKGRTIAKADPARRHYVVYERLALSLGSVPSRRKTSYTKTMTALRGTLLLVFSANVSGNEGA